MSVNMKLDMKEIFDSLDKLRELGENVSPVAVEALKKTHALITPDAIEAAQEENLPAKGNFHRKKGMSTLKSIKKDAKIEGDKVRTFAVSVGYSVRKAGPASIFMIYGKPEYMKNQKMYDAFFGAQQEQKIRRIQSEAFFDYVEKTLKK